MTNRRQTRIEGYLGRLYGYALSLIGNPDQARDLVQECVVKALSARRTPKDDAAYRAWLFRILRNAFHDRARRLGRTEPRADDPDGAASDDVVWRASHTLISVLTVRLGLAKLAPAHREIIALVDIGGFTYAEAAVFLDVPVGTVMSRLSRARRALLWVIAEGNVQELPIRSRRATK